MREHVKSYTERLQRQAKVISELDCLQSFAEIAQKYNYVRPKFSDDKTLNLENSRHPVVERVMDYNDYVPNDCYLDQNNFIYLITGPNMSGKSTYNAILPIFDQIFTRIGAADDLVSGKSTFMVEMLEAQKALTYATADSLIIFDEIGRGTSTYDGLSLAQAMIEYVSETSHAKTLFSTHYHELTTLDQQLSSLKNVHVAADEYQGELIFLHKVKEGAVDDSYGIQVAKLANLPEKVIERAQVILNAFEQNGVLDENVHRQHYNDNSKDIENKNHLNNKEEHSTIKQTDVFEQTSFDLFNSNETQSEIEAQIKNLNISNMTPIEALLKLSELQNQLR